MAKIALSRGYVALVDDADLPLLSNYSWWVDDHGKYGFYAVTEKRIGGKRKKVYMHNLLLPPNGGLHVDHINGDRLDNRRGNLRLVTARQNQQNRNPHAKTRSGFKGVWWHEECKNWQAHIRVLGTKKHLGLFETAGAAAAAYNQAARKYFGPYARLNEGVM